MHNQWPDEAQHEFQVSIDNVHVTCEIARERICETGPFKAVHRVISLGMAQLRL